MSSKTLQNYAQECVQLAQRAESPELREELLNMARDWMRDAMDDQEKSSGTAKSDPWPKASDPRNESPAA